MSVNCILTNQIPSVAEVGAATPAYVNEQIQLITETGIPKLQVYTQEVTAVSSKDQNLDRQLIALKDAGVLEENIYFDKQSGKNFNRPSYQELLNVIEENDMIIIKSIDRLGRNYSEILEQWSYITKTLKVDIKVLDMPLLDTSYGKDVMGTFISDLVLQVLSFQAESERTAIKQRQAEGIAAAHAKGIKFGRPRKSLPDNFDELYQRFLNNEPISRIAKDCPDMSLSTLRLRLMEKYELDIANSSI